MRIGLFGGSFDPVHQGHLVAAQQALGQACLDELWFLPAASPPHKAGQSRVPFQARLDMLNLALAGHPRMRVNTLESELPTPNFTVNTLRELARRHGDFAILALAAVAETYPPGGSRSLWWKWPIWW